MSGLINAEAKPSEKTYDIEALPGAWIRVQRLDHGAMIDRLGKVLVVGFNTDANSPSGDGGNAHIDHRAQRIHDFGKAILDHNLSNKKGEKYDFKNPASVFAIDPTVGDEINDIIGKHQEAIPEEELPNSEKS